MCRVPGQYSKCLGCCIFCMPLFGGGHLESHDLMSIMQKIGKYAFLVIKHPFVMKLCDSMKKREFGFCLSPNLNAQFAHAALQCVSKFQYRLLFSQTMVPLYFVCRILPMVYNPESDSESWCHYSCVGPLWLKATITWIWPFEPNPAPVILSLFNLANSGFCNWLNRQERMWKLAFLSPHG